MVGRRFQIRLISWNIKQTLSLVNIWNKNQEYFLLFESLYFSLSIMEAMKSEIFKRFIIFLSVSYKYLMGNILEYGCIAMREEYNINLIFVTRE